MRRAWQRPTLGRVAPPRIALALLLSCATTPVLAQAPDPPDPREARPERPTVATHACAVAAGMVELETGFQWQRPDPASSQFVVPVLVKIGLGKRLQFDISPGFARVGADGVVGSGPLDTVVGLKWQVAERIPLLADVAIQPTLKLPTGSVGKGTGTGTTDAGLLIVSSRSIGPVAIDLNVGYVWRSGDGSAAPTDATVWAISTGFLVTGRLGWVAEVFGYPGTRGPLGARPVVAVLTGPTFEVQRGVIVDAGAILDITGFGGTAAYAGVTWNMGRLPRGGTARRATP